jgi:hypothetical protein
MRSQSVFVYLFFRPARAGLDGAESASALGNSCPLDSFLLRRWTRKAPRPADGEAERRKPLLGPHGYNRPGDNNDIQHFQALQRFVQC